MRLSAPARVYLGVVTLAGALGIGWSAWDLITAPPPDRLWLVLLALTSFSSTFSIRIPKVTTSISVSETFVFLCALLYGPAAATIVIAIDGLLMSFWRGHRQWPQLLFNVSEPALSLIVATQVFGLVGGYPMGSRHPTNVFEGVLPLAAFTFTYFLLNSGMHAAIVSLTRRVSLWSVWRPHFGAVLLSYCGAASVAALLVYNTQGFHIATIAVVVPLLLITYYTFKSTLQRVEDANHHLEQMNRLYLSTIETLAMAVDATDQITHGHIRRVQAWAVGLARELGVSDPKELKAIEAAALLHDVGKLAIPEHILNKPGRLSSVEFEQMKKHANIGADILSAIDFPYPVVPIVRHHHEQWNGSGYPSGLRGADIPIGARILAVVDCFDALTSDRPYRRALTDEQALNMLIEQRGTAYDPLVVDTFARVFRDIAPAECDTSRRGETLREIAEVSHQPATPAPEHAGEPLRPEVLPIADAILASGQRRALTETAQDIAATLLRLTPGSLCVFFGVDESQMGLRALQATGHCATAALHVRIGLSERLSGWVATNRQTICNSDGSLDFVDDDALASAFRSCLSVPLVAGETLEGVVSLYASAPAAFDEAHRLVVESVARPLAHLVRALRAFEDAERLTSPQALAALQPFDAARALAVVDGHQGTAGVIVLRLAQPAKAQAQQATLARAVAVLRRSVGTCDGVFADGEATIVAVVGRADAAEMTRIEARLREQLGSWPVTLGVAKAPADGWNLAAVVDTAKRRACLALCPASAGEDLAEPPRQASLFDDASGPSRVGVA